MPRTTTWPQDSATVEALDDRLLELYDEIERLSAARDILAGAAPADSHEIEPTSEEEVAEAIARSSVLAEPTDMAQYLQAHLGQQLTAYLAGLKDPKTVGQWGRGKARPPALTRAASRRLRRHSAACRCLRRWRRTGLVLRGKLVSR